MDRRVLFISYAFPPVGGAGVQRTTKFVKFLREFGWQPSVLTVDNPSVPVLDGSLGEDIPADTIIRRARTWEPGYGFKAVVSAGGQAATRKAGFARRLIKGFARRVASLFLQPDAQILWMPEALREGGRLLQEVPHHAIVASGPPFSSFLLGAMLSRRSGLPLVLDYRDEWDLSSAYWENKRLGPLSHRVQSVMQRWAARTARVLLATTRSSASALEAVRASAGSKARVDQIYNGFDPDDFPARPAAAPGERYRLAYVGTLWDLTSVGPLVEAVRRLAQRAPALVERLELVFAGRRTASQEALFAGLEGLPCRLTTHAYLDHSVALDLIRSADGLCVLLSDLPGAGRVMPAKVFEYMAARRPVLAIAPPGELHDVLADYPLAHRCSPRNVDEIAGALERELIRHRQGGQAVAGRWDGERYDRRHQAGQLAALLEEIAPLPSLVAPAAPARAGFTPALVA